MKGYRSHEVECRLNNFLSSSSSSSSSSRFISVVTVLAILVTIVVSTDEIGDHCGVVVAATINGLACRDCRLSFSTLLLAASLLFLFRDLRVVHYGHAVNYSLQI